MIDGDLLVVNERLHMRGPHPIDVMWGHHPTFGSDLLAGSVEITTGGGEVTVDETYDPPANPLSPGATGTWPMIEGKTGPFDLGHPSSTMAALAYLHDFQEPWIAMRRTDDTIGVALSWDGKQFPCAWLWYELGGTRDAPWFGRASLIGLEPNTTMPANGLATAKSRGASLLRLKPDEEISTSLRLQVFKPRGPVTSVDAGGRVKMT